MGIMVTDQPGAVWSVEVVVPFDAYWSKNEMWKARVVPAGRGKAFARIYLSTPARQRRDALVFLVKRALVAAGVRVANNDLFLDVHVVKDKHNGDALNVLDLVADGVEEATGLNDKWYHANVTWEMGADPVIRVGVSQRSDVDLQVCAACLDRKVYEEFTARATNITGREGTCRECQARKRKAAK